MIQSPVVLLLDGSRPSVRGAACSMAAEAGVTTKDILDAAVWSSGNFSEVLL